MKLVVYVFHEYNQRVVHFLKHGIFKHPEIQFVVVCNGMMNVPVPDYVRYVKRPNVGYDFGAWSEVLLTDDYYKQFTEFVFVNSSVWGPFVPPYSQNWVDCFTHGLKYTHLFGSTINALPHQNTIGATALTESNFWLVHVQSFAFCMTFEALEILISKQIFSLDMSHSFLSTVVDREIRMSTEILKSGKNIGCLMRCYAGVDFRTKSNFLGDLMFQGAYYGTTFHPYEVMFLKGNRIPRSDFLNLFLK
jgi:hypothetical protein